GHLELVSSATRRNTRDVGVTFPTPSSSQQLRDRARGRRSRLPWHPGQRWGWGWGASKGPWVGMDSRHRDCLKSFSLTGTPWLPPAEDWQWESRKENQCSATAGPGPAWFEPWSSTKPWREPLRERNWEQQPS
ncbi:ALMS1 protein, partial [Sitta europaea]|nr:ALMS1 protein [Sitta europaea]